MAFKSILSQGQTGTRVFIPVLIFKRLEGRKRRGRKIILFFLSREAEEALA
jgi:hypothetical protein